MRVNHTDLRRAAAREAGFQPVIIGADVLGYTLVRELHRCYGVRPILLAGADVRMTTRTRLADVEILPGVDRREVLFPRLAEIVQSLPDGVVPVVLAAASDWHVRMLTEFRAELEAMGYVVPYLDFDLLDSISQKATFYSICDRLGIPFPRTWILPIGGEAEVPSGQRITVISEAGALAGESFPLIVKPSNSAAWHYADVEDKHKVYTVDSLAELELIEQRVRRSSYRHSLLVQEMLSDTDTSIHILTAFGTGDGRTQVPVTGDVFLQDRSPSGIGNPMVILGDRRRNDLIEYAEAFIQETGYEGFANFDIMDDADGNPHFLEVNTRPGRSSYFYCLGGCSIVRPLIEHFVFGRELGQALTPAELAADREFLFTTVPRSVILREVDTVEQRERVNRLWRAGVWGNPVLNPDDALKQRFWAQVNFQHMRARFRSHGR